MEYCVSYFQDLTTRMDELLTVVILDLIMHPSLMKIIKVNGLTKVVWSLPGSSYIRYLP